MDKDDLCAGDDQKEKMSSENSSSRPNEVTPALDFSELTPSQFGISVQSFIPSATNKGERSHGETACPFSGIDCGEPWSVIDLMLGVFLWSLGTRTLICDRNIML